jgi:hypothetical protein
MLPLVHPLQYLYISYKLVILLRPASLAFAILATLYRSHRLVSLPIFFFHFRTSHILGYP